MREGDVDVELASTAPSDAPLDVTATDATRRPRQAPADGDPLIGVELAHFRLEQRLGRGAMGVVYRATDLSLDRAVAVKILPDAIAAAPKLRERFYREARAQARIRHPNVCHIYFVGEDRDRLFFAMELIEGETVAERLVRAGKLPLEDALDVCIGVARGLAAAHAHGFTHRDIKPSNLMIDANGMVRILDFGLVTRGDAGDPSDDDDAESDRTRATIGTPLYMSPEQARGDAVDLRADIYALGVMLHELVSGEPPFRAATAAELARLHESEPRPSIRRGRRAPKHAAIADELCDRMMAKRRDDRFADYDALLVALHRASPRLTPPVRALTRWIASAIDVVGIGFVLALPTDLLRLATGRGERLFALLLVVALPVYFAVAWSRWGRTIGMSTFHLELVPMDRDGRPSVKQALHRVVSTWRWSLVGAVLIVGAGLVPRIDVSGLNASSLVTTAGALIVGVGVVRVFAIGLWSTSRAARRRTPWDRASRTEVVFRTARSGL